MQISHRSLLHRRLLLRFTAYALPVLVFCSVGAWASEGMQHRRDEPLVNVAEACPGVLIELRYATPRNLTGAPIYPPNSHALLRRTVAERLLQAQRSLAAQGFGLKVWDAYRPPFAQEELWAARPNREFIGDPAKGGSLHAWGVAVDVTLVDRSGKELRMPTGFDEFGPAAARRYIGSDREIATNLRTLQLAMVAAGFLPMRDEWWHFAAKDFRSFGRVTPPVALTPTDP
ncbi:MAG: peptidase M15 [Verrucomicrobiaceae bacterium]|nr:MAG: peptidase M15 [Verrucomicrobiaceae bacterium]